MIDALVVTEDDVRHKISVRAHEAAAFLAMVDAAPVLLYDPENRTLIAANLVGEWLPADWSGLKETS